jgi:hypothetical protein
MVCTYILLQIPVDLCLFAYYLVLETHWVTDAKSYPVIGGERRPVDADDF